MSLHVLGDGDDSDPLSQRLTEMTSLLSCKAFMAEQNLWGIFWEMLNLPSSQIAGILRKDPLPLYRCL